MEGAGRFLSPVLSCGFSSKFYTFVLLFSAQPPPAVDILLLFPKVTINYVEESVADTFMVSDWPYSQLSTKQFFLMRKKWGPRIFKAKANINNVRDWTVNMSNNNSDFDNLVIKQKLKVFLVAQSH